MKINKLRFLFLRRSKQIGEALLRLKNIFSIVKFSVGCLAYDIEAETFNFLLNQVLGIMCCISKADKIL